MKTILLSLSFFLLSYACFAQTTATTLVLLNVAGGDSKPISTSISFENETTHRKLNFTSDKDGLAKCVVPMGAKYSISIPDGTESYDFDIPDLTLDTLTLNLTFHIIDTKSAGAKNAVVAFKILNGHGIKHIAASTKTIAFTKDAEVDDDSAFINLPVNNNYIISADGVTIKNNTIAVDNTPFNILYYVLFFNDDKHAELIPIKKTDVIFWITYVDLSKNPVANEELEIKDKKSHIYKVITDANGNAFKILPREDIYTLSLKTYPDFADVAIEKDQTVLTVYEVPIRFPSSAQIEEDRKEELARAATRDSLYKIAEKSKELTSAKLIFKLTDSMSIIQRALDSNKKYFEDTRNVVCAVLYRNKDKWKSRMIVTDVTGSMFPYAAQLTTWHILETLNKENSQYVFFNDGDGKPESEKGLGTTGGIYYNPYDQPDAVVSVMYTAMKNGDGGEIPENDIEALIKAQSLMRPGNTELILIADNYSPIRDMALLYKIKVPVRVILCGVNEWINSDCLEIAYKTKGSIHTIDQDVYDLSKLHDGDFITIGGKTFRFEKGMFFVIKL